MPSSSHKAGHRMGGPSRMLESSRSGFAWKATFVPLRSPPFPAACQNLQSWEQRALSDPSPPYLVPEKCLPGREECLRSRSRSLPSSRCLYEVWKWGKRSRVNRHPDWTDWCSGLVCGEGDRHCGPPTLMYSPIPKENKMQTAMSHMPPFMSKTYAHRISLGGAA